MPAEAERLLLPGLSAVPAPQHGDEARPPGSEVVIGDVETRAGEHVAQIMRALDFRPGGLRVSMRTRSLAISRADGMGGMAGGYPVSSMSSRPMSQRRISLVPAPIS